MIYQRALGSFERTPPLGSVSPVNMCLFPYPLLAKAKAMGGKLRNVKKFLCRGQSTTSIYVAKS